MSQSTAVRSGQRIHRWLAPRSAWHPTFHNAGRQGRERKPRSDPPPQVYVHAGPQTGWSPRHPPATSPASIRRRVSSWGSQRGRPRWAPPRTRPREDGRDPPTNPTSGWAVPPRPPSKLAAPSPGLAPLGRPSSPHRRSDGVTADRIGGPRPRSTSRTMLEALERRRAASWDRVTVATLQKTARPEAVRHCFWCAQGARSRGSPPWTPRHRPSTTRRPIRWSQLSGRARSSLPTPRRRDFRPCSGSSSARFIWVLELLEAL